MLFIEYFSFQESEKIKIVIRFGFTKFRSPSQINVLWQKFLKEEPPL